MRKLLLAIPLAAVAAFAAGRLLCRYRPVSIPPALAREVIRMKAEGWTVPRWEPLACREHDLHTHLTAPGGLTLSINVDGRVVVGTVPAF